MEEARKYVATCPGERYAISPAICKARRERNYPRCRGCVFNPDAQPGEADPAEDSPERTAASIFKAYDIRGTYPGQIDVAMARRIGQATAIYLKAHTLVVGHDVRVSSPELSEALIEGILSVGTSVADVGLCSTPFHYFAVGTLRCDGGIMVTASHNPPQYNGFKISRRDVVPVGGESGLAEIRRMVETDEPPPPVKKRGRRVPMDLKANYIKHVLSFSRPGPRALKVAVDTSNGSAGLYVLDLFRELPHEIVPLYLEPDGRFPHHDPNPLVDENLFSLIDRVRESEADLGVALDGDADRIAVVTEQGKRVPNDILTALLAREVLREEPGAAIVYDLRSSRVVPEEIEAAGGKPIEERVGHAFIKKTMRDHDAPFGGELSGHFYFRENFFADNGLMAMMKVLNVLSRSDEPMSALVAPLQRYHSTGEVNFRVADQDAKIALIQRHFADAEITHLDGITVRYPDWWFNLRKSNTEPLLRLTLEARSPELLEEARVRLFELLGRPVK